MQRTFSKQKPLSWSQISAFQYNPESWYKKYFLKEPQDETLEMRFGKKFADSCEKRKPLAPVTLYSEVEYPLSVSFDSIPLVGYVDSYEPHTHLCEYKTGKKTWDKKRVDGHGQITMYAMMIYISHKVKPEDLNIKLEWIPTEETGGFEIDFVKPIKVHSFPTKRTMNDILRFGLHIKDTIIKMDEYIASVNNLGLTSLYDKTTMKQS